MGYEMSLISVFLCVLCVLGGERLKATESPVTGDGLLAVVFLLVFREKGTVDAI